MCYYPSQSPNNVQFFVKPQTASTDTHLKDVQDQNERSLKWQNNLTSSIASKRFDGSYCSMCLSIMLSYGKSFFIRTPALHISILWEYCFFALASGAMYLRVPTLPVSYSLVWGGTMSSAILLSPKSTNFALPERESTTLEGLMSLWMIFSGFLLCR